VRRGRDSSSDDLAPDQLPARRPHLRIVEVATYEGKRVRDAAHHHEVDDRLAARGRGGELGEVRDKKEIRLPALNALLGAELLDVGAVSVAGR
jgi:hypothetical protein